MKQSISTTWLIAEDNEDDYILLRRAFRKVAPQTKLQWVKDGVEARSYLSGEAPFEDRTVFPLPSVILADLKMPRCNGFELLKWTRTRPDLKSLRFIVFSSSDQPSDVALAYQLGANWYLTKPVELEQLVEMLARLFEHVRLDWQITGANFS
jgi:CheY-like chemotaxis protein